MLLGSINSIATQLFVQAIHCFLVIIKLSFQFNLSRVAYQNYLFRESFSQKMIKNTGLMFERDQLYLMFHVGLFQKQTTTIGTSYSFFLLSSQQNTTKYYFPMNYQEHNQTSLLSGFAMILLSIFCETVTNRSDLRNISK